MPITGRIEAISLVEGDRVKKDSSSPRSFPAI